MESIMGTKKKKKEAAEQKKNELIQIRIDVAKPGSKKYTHVDWEELMKIHGHNKDEDALRRFYDEDTLFMAKKLSETKSKSGKQIRVNLDFIQHLNRNCGYDMEDDFIDDTEAVDDMNVVTKKGGFYVGKGAVKAMEDDEEEEESEEEELEVQRKPRQKLHHKHREKEKAGAQDSSSDSDSSREPVRMTGAPPTARMTGAPPSKRILAKRPSPPVLQRKDSSPPPRASSVELVAPEKKKATPPKVNPSSSSSSDIQVIEDVVSEEPPAKKKAPELPPVVATVSNASTISVASSSSSVMIATPPSSSPQKQAQSSLQQQSSSTKGSTLTMMAKKIVREEELSKKVSPQKELPANITSLLTNCFASLNAKGMEFKRSGGKKLDKSTLKEIIDFVNVTKHHKLEKSSIETLTTNIAKTFGLTIEELGKQLLEEAQPTNHTVQIKKEAVDPPELRLTQADLPHMTESDIVHLTTIVNAWKDKKDIPADLMNQWLKDVKQGRLNVDIARKKFFYFVTELPDLEKQTQESGLEIPKHERSRKARMFLHQWVYLSRKYVEKILPTLKKPPTTEGYAKKQVIAANALKEALRKQMAAFEAKKDKPSDAVYAFQFTEPVLAAVFAYLDELVDYSLSIGKLDIIVHGIDSLHQALDNKITLIQFYIELCRRIQKLSFLTVEEPMKSRLDEAKELITKHQVVQNIKYQIKWPGGVEPSLRGLGRELQDFKVSVLANWKQPSAAPATPKASTSSVPASIARPVASVPSTSAAPAPLSFTSSSIAANAKQLLPREPTEDERRMMNTIVQNQLEKYLLATGSCSTADICDPTVAPLSDDMLFTLITAVCLKDVQPMNQMIMFKNVLAHVGQSRMAQAVGKKRSDTQLTTQDYQALFEYFAKYEIEIARKRVVQAEIEERERRIAEERLKRERKEAEKEQREREKREKLAELKELKEREKQMEREKKEREKAEEKERKEREKREERERKEREAKEAAEQKAREEEDRRTALEMLRRQAEEARRKREAEELAQKNAEQKARMETEAAAASQELEEDLLMDDADFLTEQQSRVDQERSIAESKRAVERENQIKMMRAQQLQKLGQQKPEEPPATQSEQSALEWMESIDAARRAKFHTTWAQQMAPPPDPPAPPRAVPLPQEHMTQNHHPAPIPISIPIPTPHEQPQAVFTHQQQQQQLPPPPPPQYNNNNGLNGSNEIQWIDNGNGLPINNLGQIHMPIPIREVKNEVDILNAAQEAAGLPAADIKQETYFNQQEDVIQNHHPNHNVFAPPPPALDKPMTAFDKLASLRGRTLSADVKRLSEVGGPSSSSEQQQQQPQMMLQPQQAMYQNGAPTTPFCTPTPGTSNQQHFFPDQKPDANVIEAQRRQRMEMEMEQQKQNMLKEQHMRMQQMQMQQQKMVQNQNQNQMNMNMNMNMGMPNSYFNGNIENTRRSLSMSQQPPAYQSPVHHNSSLMHTPMSNGSSSMLSQSPQFSAHPSPMSQQFHTPPSVGMGQQQQMGMMGSSPMNSGQMQNPMALNQPQQPQQQQQQPLQHFNFPPQFSQQQQQQQQQHQHHQQHQQQLQQQMHRQMSQQHQMQHPHQMMRQMSQHHNYPPH